MRYVMVPVPSEYVLDVMRWVLFRAPDEAGDGTMRDEARVRAVLTDASELERSLLLLVARGALENEPPTVTDVAVELDQSAQAIGLIVGTLNQKAGGTDIVKVQDETAIGVQGKTGRIAFLAMRREIARLIRAEAKATGAAAE